MIRDIAPHKGHTNGDKWAKYYAKMEYDRIKWHDLWQPTQYIEVKDHPDKVNICLSCGELNDWYKWSCYKCEAEGERNEQC